MQSKAKVEVVQQNDSFSLYVDGKPFFIKGAAGPEHYRQVKEMGGNTVRTWTTENAAQVLDWAEQEGLKVMLGLWMTPEHLGFDYNDDAAVKKQMEAVLTEVETFKNHPALLMWCIGNELDLKMTNTAVWDAVNETAIKIKEIDGQHPVTTTIMPHWRSMLWVKLKCPDLDILSFNTFGEIHKLPEKISHPIWGWNGPYMLSEWGSTGWWESDFTDWGAAIEENSSLKAEMCRMRYDSFVNQNTSAYLGAFMFYWGQKFEKTPTWFSLFGKNGEKTELLWYIKHIWTGKEASNQPPKILDFKIEAKTAYQNIKLLPSDRYSAKIYIKDLQKDSLIYEWLLFREYEAKLAGEDQYINPINLLTEDENIKHSEIKFTTPNTQGSYRLYVNIYDDKFNLATANIPFLVE